METKKPDATSLEGRNAPIEIEPEQWREMGHRLVDRIADWMRDMPRGPVTPGESPRQVRDALGAGQPLPLSGGDPARLLDDAATFLFDHSLFIGHPSFYGFITSAPAPIGALADLLASSVNPNLGGFVLSPAATEIERQTVSWIAELLGYPPDCGGLLVSGGNMANFVGFLAARRAKAPWDIRSKGVASGSQRLRVYTSAETHTWVQKAADLFGLGTDSIRWVGTDVEGRMKTTALREQIEADKAAGDLPFIVVGTGGSVSTGAIDPLREIAAIAREHDLWFHVDGAYGGFAAALPSASPDLKALALADSVAIDPHKWLYTPIEAGCALVRDPRILHDTFVYHPPYYHMEEYDEDPAINFHEWGPQNTRGFRALKVWLALKQVGREGYERMISDDISLTRKMFEYVGQEPELEPLTCELSIATFRYVPPDVTPGTPEGEDYLNRLNAELCERLQTGGEAFVSNAVIGGRFALRACIVNFRTSEEHVRALPGTVIRAGRALHREIQGR